MSERQQFEKWYGNIHRKHRNKLKQITDGKYHNSFIQVSYVAFVSGYRKAINTPKHETVSEFNPLVIYNLPPDIMTNNYEFQRLTASGDWVGLGDLETHWILNNVVYGTKRWIIRYREIV